MAQTITRVLNPAIGMLGKMKLGVLNVANGAAETSIAINWENYGLRSVKLYGIQPLDIHTDDAMYASLSGTTVTYTWTAVDIANVLVWAIGE